MRALIVEQLEASGSSQDSVLAVFTDDNDPLPAQFADELNKRKGDSYTTFKVVPYESPPVNPNTITEIVGDT